MDQENVDASRRLRIVVDVDSALVNEPVVQHLTWLLVTLLTRTTNSVFAIVAISVADAPLLPGVDPSAPEGGRSLLDALKATADVFGPEAAPVVDEDGHCSADLVLRIGDTATADWSGAKILNVSASGWTGAVAPNASAAPLLNAGENSYGAYVAACLAASQAYMYTRVRDYHLQPVALNAWTLAQATTDLGVVASVDPGEPSVVLDHVLAGVGAVGTALLLTLWAYRPVSGTIRAGDSDLNGIEDTNLSRCLPFHRSDLGLAKAVVAADRLSGYHGLVIAPTAGDAQNLVDSRTHLISAVDTPDSRQALQDKYPASAVQASTSGLRLEMLRVNPTVNGACLRCFNPPREETPDNEIRAQVADMNEATIAAHAAALSVEIEQVREWGRVGGCGRIGDALLSRLRPSDGTSAQFSVGFMSVIAGVLLAAQVLKDAIRRAGDPERIALGAPLAGTETRFVSNVLSPENTIAVVRRYDRDHECPACQGIRAEVWANRWTG